MHNSFVIKGNLCQTKTAKALDFHIHAPQYAFRGMCMDLELMDWLNQYTFSEEKNIITLHLVERTERAVYLGLDEKKITAKYVAGERIFT